MIKISINIQTEDNKLLRIASVNGTKESMFIDTNLSTTSTNPVENRIITNELNEKAQKEHTHITSDITDFPTSLPASDVYDWAKAENKPSYNKSEVGLSNVDNTSDLNKPVSTAQQTAIDLAYTNSNKYTDQKIADSKKILEQELEKAVNEVSFDKDTSSLVVTKKNGSEKKIPLSSAAYIVSDTAPTETKSLWIDTSAGGVTKYYNGTDWLQTAIQLDSEFSETSTNPVENQVIASEINNLKKSVSDGKVKVANAITAKGVTTATDATFETIATNVGKIATLSNDTADATATASQILDGQTAYVNGSKITGTMTNRGAVSQSLAINGSYTIPAGYHNGSGKVTQSVATKAAATYTPGTTNQTISSGQYLSGAQTIKGDANLISANILPGKTIFGVIGTATVDATAVAGDILTGRTAYVGGNKVTGTMTDRGAISAFVSIGSAYTIPPGYHNGYGKIRPIHNGKLMEIITLTKTIDNSSAGSVSSGVTKTFTISTSGQLLNPTMLISKELTGHGYYQGIYTDINKICTFGVVFGFENEVQVVVTNVAGNLSSGAWVEKITLKVAGTN